MRDIGAIQRKFRISCIEDIVTARQSGCSMADEMGCSGNKRAIAATAISELARNMLLHANSGEILLAAKHAGGQGSLVVEAVDNGPGISNLDRAMRSGYSSSGGAGYGLSGVRAMVDEFVISSHAGEGTVVTVEIRMN